MHQYGDLDPARTTVLTSPDEIIKQISRSFQDYCCLLLYIFTLDINLRWRNEDQPLTSSKTLPTSRTLSGVRWGRLGFFLPPLIPGSDLLTVVRWVVEMVSHLVDFLLLRLTVGCPRVGYFCKFPLAQLHEKRNTMFSTVQNLSGSSFRQYTTWKRRN